MANHEGKNSSFALKLKQYRDLCRLTQQQVADILNINRTTYTKYETGVSEPSHEVLRKIVSIYGVDYNTLFGKQESFKPNVYDSDDGLKLYNLTDEEKMLVIAYRAMSDNDKKTVLADANEKSGITKHRKMSGNSDKSSE